MITNLIVKLSTIPDAVWAAGIASLLTLSGVMLSNRSNTKRLERQLKHDSVEKSKARLAELRRQVYLEAAEEMARISGSLGSIPSMDPRNNDLSAKMNSFFTSAAKAQLISGIETSKHIGELVVLYSELFFKLMAKASPIHDLQIDIEICSEYYEKYSSDTNRILSEMTHYNELGETNEGRFSRLQNSLNNANTSMRQYADERSILFDKRNTLNKEFMLSILTETKNVNEIQLQVMILMREELELDTDYEEFKNRLVQNQNRIQVQIDKFISETMKD
jgi:hypothetical protein